MNLTGLEIQRQQHFKLIRNTLFEKLGRLEMDMQGKTILQKLTFFEFLFEKIAYI